MTPEFRLDDKVILVTGAAGLIGAEVCDAFAAYGARLVMTDMLPLTILDSRAGKLRDKHNANVLAVQADLRSDESVRDLLSAVSQRFGHVDVLVNLAALDAKFDGKIGEVEPSRFENYPIDMWQRSLEVNCTGLFRITQAVARLMLPRKSGAIINVASTYSLVAPNQDLYKLPGQDRQIFKPVDYVATKSMVPNFTRYLATLYARDGIRCNAIVPHGIDNRHSPAFRENFARLSPLGRMCDVKELRGPFVFLASDAASYMTGSLLVVDGGWTAW